MDVKNIKNDIIIYIIEKYIIGKRVLSSTTPRDIKVLAISSIMLMCARVLLEQTGEIIRCKIIL